MAVQLQPPATGLMFSSAPAERIAGHKFDINPTGDNNVR
jgi:hypothetical protein